MNALRRDLLAAGRVSNLPTVWSNLICGASIALTLSSTAHISASFIITLIVGSTLYTAGCFYNDYYDRTWDAQHKPDRAIPSGRLSPKLLLILVLTLGGTGVLLSFFTGRSAVITALAIIFFVWLYTRTHKKTVLAIIPMGLCRAGLYILGFTSVNQSHKISPIAVPALGLICYIAGITLIARSEATNTLPKGAKWVGLILLVTPSITHPSPFNILITGAFALYQLFNILNIKKTSVGAFVGKSLALICIVDCLAITRLGSLQTSAPYYLLLGATLGCFILAKWLQKIAPAT